jgi:hypothetical protein
MNVAPQLAQPACLKYLSSRNINCLPSGLSYYSCVPPKSGKTRHLHRKHAIRKTAKTNTVRSGSQTPQPRVARLLDSELVDAEVAARAAAQAPVPRIFLLSPANAAGIRAQLMLRQSASFPLALKLRDGCLTLGEAFSFISGLYFRGKLAYARAFAQAPPNTPGALVITACGGLLPPEMLITREVLGAISSAPVSISEERYRIPLERDANLVAEHIGTKCEVILLGSIATPKYIEPLLKIFGERLLFPAEFAGRGDMSRGGLMLRCARSGRQLTYVPVATAKRHGARPPKLPRATYGPAWSLG